MADTLLQVNFELNVPTAEYEQMAATIAETFARVQGLRWKVWFLNEERRDAGGIYLFEDDRALEAFAASSLADSIRTHPALRNVTMKRSTVMPGVTAVTRGPVAHPMHA